MNEDIVKFFCPTTVFRWNRSAVILLGEIVRLRALSERKWIHSPMAVLTNQKTQKMRPFKYVSNMGRTRNLVPTTSSVNFVHLRSVFLLCYIQRWRSLEKKIITKNVYSGQKYSEINHDQTATLVWQFILVLVNQYSFQASVSKGNHCRNLTFFSTHACLRWNMWHKSHYYGLIKKNWVDLPSLVQSNWKWS